MKSVKSGFLSGELCRTLCQYDRSRSSNKDPETIRYVMRKLIMYTES